MFCVMWLDTASSSSDPVAARTHHRIWRPVAGGGSSGATSAGFAALRGGVTTAGAAARFRLDQPAAAQRPTKSA